MGFEFTTEQKIQKIELVLMFLINMMRRTKVIPDVELDRVEKILSEGH
jgi:hypothetical protein